VGLFIELLSGLREVGWIFWRPGKGMGELRRKGVSEGRGEAEVGVRR